MEPRERGRPPTDWPELILCTARAIRIIALYSKRMSYRTRRPRCSVACRWATSRPVTDIRDPRQRRRFARRQPGEIGDPLFPARTWAPAIDLSMGKNGSAIAGRRATDAYGGASSLRDLRYDPVARAIVRFAS